MTSLIVKVTLTPLLIGAVTLAGRRWGHGVSGWLAGLPLTSGPVSYFLADEQGPAFAARAAVGTLAGVIAVAAFCLTYASVARRRAWGWSMTAGLLAYGAVAALSSTLPLTLVPTVAGLLVVIALTVRFMPILAGTKTADATPWWNTPLRMLVATALVLGLTRAAAALGPQWSGLLSPFPIYATVLGAFTHRHAGAAAAQRLQRGIVLGNVAFGSFFLVVGLALGHWSLPAIYATATMGAAVTSLATRRLVAPEPA